MGARAFTTGYQEQNPDGSRTTEEGTRLYPLRDSMGNPIAISRMNGATAYEYLEAGEKYIREHGWIKGDWGDNSVCALGGVLKGADLLKQQKQFPLHLMRNLRAATEALYKSIPLNKVDVARQKAYESGGYYSLDSRHEQMEAVVAGYNDLEATTEADILKLFEDAKQIAPRTNVVLSASEQNQPIFLPDDETVREKALKWVSPVDEPVS